jgi:hypothetical protein
MKKLVLYILFFAALFSCQKEELSQSQALGYFDKINFESYFDVELIQGNETKIVYIGSEKAVKNLSITVEDSVLTLKNTSNWLWLNPDKNKMKLKITFQDLKQLNVYESCEIFSKDTLTGDELGVIFASKLNNANLKLNYNTFFYYNNHPCGGKLTLSGSCNYLKIWNYALMQVDASELNSHLVTIDNYSKGDCKVKTPNWIEYAIYGEGNIYCYGNPTQVVAKNSSTKGKFYLE